jgi:hypothetical protein
MELHMERRGERGRGEVGEVRDSSAVPRYSDGFLR